jgi:transcription antitermination factor NusG
MSASAVARAPEGPSASHDDAPAPAKFGHGGARPGSGPKPHVATPVADRWIGPRWCPFQVHPQAERLAASELTRAGYRTYAPLFATKRQDPVIRSLWHKVHVPRFVGWGFVSLGPSDPWRPVRDTAGVLRVVHGDDGRPYPIPEGQIERCMEDDARLADLAAETMIPLTPGAPVTIGDGAFADYRAVVLRCDGRVTLVEVLLFGRPIPVHVSRASLTVIATGA